MGVNVEKQKLEHVLMPWTVRDTEERMRLADKCKRAGRVWSLGNIRRGCIIYIEGSDRILKGDKII